MVRSLFAALGFPMLIVCLTACDAAAPAGPSGVPATHAPSGVPAPSTGTAAHTHTGGPSTAAALGADVNQQIAQLRRLMAPFHNFEKAVEYGYDTPAPGPGVCLSDPARGGMGYHYTMSKKDLVSDGVVNLLEPEFIVYSPMPNGGVRLSSADYFVPYATWSSPEPPTLLGVPFAREDALNAYVLHIWAFWPNPAGMFENFNPDVPLCPE
jgi:hypothetical protein